MWNVKDLGSTRGYAIVDERGTEIAKGVHRPATRKLFLDICQKHNAALTAGQGDGK